jgi:hypothetical protein
MLINMKKYFKGSVLLILVSIGIFTPVHIYATPPSFPGYTCNIVGIIKSVEFKNIPSVSGGPFSGEIYNIGIRVNSTSKINDEQTLVPAPSCEDMYPVGSVQAIVVVKDELGFGDVPFLGNKIFGVVKSSYYNSHADMTRIFSEVDIQTSGIVKVIIIGIIFGAFLGIIFLFKRVLSQRRLKIK